MAVDFEKNIYSLPELTVYIRSVLSKTTRTTDMIKHISGIMHFEDVLFYTWKILMKTLSANPESHDIFMLNVLELLENIPISKVVDKKKQQETDQSQIIGLPKDSENFVLDLKLLQKYVRKVWQLLVNREISPAVHKKLLFVLLESHLSKLDNPLFLTDFFMASMNVKGVIRILALQGVATLMQKHNIEYPNVYGKLYTLFEPSIFHTKYKSRLFFLANIFLSSTKTSVTCSQEEGILIFVMRKTLCCLQGDLGSRHLPENLVASFAKRASRLSLTCGTPDVLIILRFVANLLIRHTGLIKMVHHPGILEVAEDPFLEDENDPMKTRASESSLWEISLLNSHCQPSVSSAAKFIHFKLPSLEFDLAEVLDNSYEKMFELECRKTKKIKPSLTFQKPLETIAKLKDDQVFKLWSLTT